MTVEDRMASLERQVKFLRLALVALVLIVVAGFGLGAATITDTIRASKIIVPRAASVGYSHCLTFEAEGGQKMAELQLRRSGPSLWMYDTSGRHVVTLGTSFNDFGGSLSLEGKPGEQSSVRISGRGVNVMGRQVSGGIGPWMSLYHHKGVFSGLEIRGAGAEMIKLDNRDGTARIEVLDADGKATLLTP